MMIENIREICKSLENKKVYVAVLDEERTFWEGEDRYFSHMGHLKILDNSIMILDVFGDAQLSYNEIAEIFATR